MAIRALKYSARAPLCVRASSPLLISMSAAISLDLHQLHILVSACESRLTILLEFFFFILFYYYCAFRITCVKRVFFLSRRTLNRWPTARCADEYSSIYYIIFNKCTYCFSLSVKRRPTSNPPARRHHHLNTHESTHTHLRSRDSFYSTLHTRICI